MFHTFTNILFFVCLDQRKIVERENGSMKKYDYFIHSDSYLDLPK